VHKWCKPVTAGPYVHAFTVDVFTAELYFIDNHLYLIEQFNDGFVKPKEEKVGYLSAAADSFLLFVSKFSCMQLTYNLLCLTFDVFSKATLFTAVVMAFIIESSKTLDNNDLFLYHHAILKQVEALSDVPAGNLSLPSPSSADITLNALRFLYIYGP